jgi:dihydrofolate reductase
MKLIVNAFVTLDMVMQAPGGPDEDREGSFQFGGWVGPYFDNDMGSTIQQSLEGASAFLLGRKTYDIFAGYWPTATEDPEVAEVLNSRPKYVASTTLKQPEWQHTTVIPGGVADAVAKLKAGPGDELNVQGSANLLQSLHPLVDEYRLWICPVHLGSGKRLFEDGSHPSGLDLIDTHTNSLGAIYATYRPTGKPETGQLGN